MGQRYVEGIKEDNARRLQPEQAGEKHVRRANRVIVVNAHRTSHPVQLHLTGMWIIYSVAIAIQKCINSNRI